MDYPEDHWPRRPLLFVVGDLREVETPDFVRLLFVTKVGCYAEKPVADALDMIKRAAEPPTSEAIGDPTALKLFDWHISEISPAILAKHVEKPGIVIAMRYHVRKAELLEELDDPACRTGLAERLRGFAAENAQVAAYLRLPEAQIEPKADYAYDVFVSYAGEDAPLAQELRDSLTKAGIKSFLAMPDIGAGQLWNAEIRRALNSSRIVLALMTNHSIAKPWVLAEAGAAWALEKHLIPACMGVTPKQLPEFIGERQAREIQTIAARTGLVEEIKKLCEK